MNNDISLYKKFQDLDDSLENFCLNIKNYLFEDFDNEENHKKFIKETFDKFHKEELLKSDVLDYTSCRFDINNMSRIIHTNNVFLLGYSIYNNLNVDEYFNNEYFDKYNKKEEQFKLIWFLSAIIHDFLFDIENEKGEKNYEDINGDIETLLNKFNIDNKLYNNGYLSVFAECNKVNKFYRILKNYYKYRYCYDDKIDHGIATGIVLFDVLVKNRKKKQDQCANKKYWKEGLNKIYAEACLYISAHNIWSPNSKEKEKTYKDYRLELLVDTEENENIFPIKFNEMPYLFLLGLADTLEPTKNYNENASDVLKNINIDFDKKSLTISKNKTSKLDFTKMTKKVRGLETWLAVEVCVSNSSIKITIL